MGELLESSGNAPRSAEDAGHTTAFGDVRFNTLTGELQRNGKIARLTPKAAAVLTALLEGAPGLVTKEQFLSRVWGGRAISDEALTSCILELRRALDDDARNPCYIETRHRRGYRLLKAVAAADAQPTPNAARDPFKLSPAVSDTGVPDLTLPEKPSIAVLPFQNLSGDPDQEYFTDGIAEDITTELSRFSSLFVIARNSSFSYKGRFPDVRQIGRELGVRYVLEGSIRKSLNRIRVTAQLIDTLTANHIWAERYDRVIEDIFAVQEEVTRAIVAAIAPEIESTEQSKAARRRPGNLSAYEIALRATAHGLEAVGKSDKALIERSIREAREALAIDPTNVRALLALSHSHGTALMLGTLGMGMDHRQAFEQATWAATRAIELEHSNARAYAMRALAILRSRQIDRYPDGLADARRAHQLNSNDVEVLKILAALETGVGESEEAIAHAQQALRLSPLDPYSHVTFGLLASVTFGAKQYAECVGWASRALNNSPSMKHVRFTEVVGLVGMGEIDKATTAFAALQRLAPEGRRPENAEALYGRAEDRARWRTFLRIAAGLEDPSAADALR
jgi:TolB-like protein